MSLLVWEMERALEHPVDPKDKAAETDNREGRWTVADDVGRRLLAVVFVEDDLDLPQDRALLHSELLGGRLSGQDQQHLSQSFFPRFDHASVRPIDQRDQEIKRSREGRKKGERTKAKDEEGGNRSKGLKVEFVCAQKLIHHHKRLFGVELEFVDLDQEETGQRSKCHLPVTFPLSLVSLFSVLSAAKGKDDETHRMGCLIEFS